MLAIDTETGLPSNAEPVPRLVSVAVYDGNEAYLYNAWDPNARAATEAALRLGFIAANAPFDVFAILRQWPELLPNVIDAYHCDRIIDVITRDKLLAIAYGEKIKDYSIGDIAKRRCDIELDKSDDSYRRRYIELIDTPCRDWPDAARGYALRDPWANWNVCQVQERLRHVDLTDFAGRPVVDLFEDAGRQARAHLALYAQTLRGVHTDQAQVERVAADMDAEIKRLGTKLYHAGLARIGGTRAKRKLVANTKAAQEILQRDAKRVRATKTGVSLDDDAIRDAKLPAGHVLHDFVAYKSLRTLYRKTIPVLRRPWIRTRYDELKETGRTGSSAPQGRRKVEALEPWEWIGTNLQNQPRTGGFRECIVPPPGYRFVTSDYKGAELVGLGQVQIDLFQRSPLADIINAGRDVHQEFGIATMLGLPYEAYDPSNPEHKEARQAAKAWNFGKWGGMGRLRFQAYALGTYGVEIDDDRYYAIDGPWRERFDAETYFNDVRRRLDFEGRATIVHHRSNRVRGGCPFPVACNTKFQGIAADFIKLSMWWIFLDGLDPKSPLYGGCPVDPDTGRVPLTGQALHVHDENVLAVPAERAEAARRRQDFLMIEAGKVFCPDMRVTTDSTVSERYEKP